jgi:hypothetical protein
MAAAGGGALTSENSEKVCKPLILGSAYFRKQLILL